MSPRDDERGPGGGRVTSTRSTLTVTQDADERLEQARAYLAARGIEDEAWAQSIAAHHRPLPANRLWNVRKLERLRGLNPVGPWAIAISLNLTPEQGTTPQPLCPMACFLAHSGAVS